MNRIKPISDLRTGRLRLPRFMGRTAYAAQPIDAISGTTCAAFTDPPEGNLNGLL